MWSQVYELYSYALIGYSYDLGLDFDCLILQRRLHFDVSAQ